MGDFKVVGDFLVRNNEKDSSENKEKYQFKNLLYKTEISQWLVESHKQIFNITNLSLAITQYQEVVERL